MKTRSTSHDIPSRAIGTLLALICVVAGCNEEIQTQYGQRQGSFSATSVNGTAVLGDMFEKAGHRVYSWRSLSPRLEDRGNCIVWWPDNFEPPRKEAQEWLENWLLSETDRTLIYVGRDYDAEIDYWKSVEPLAPEDQKREVRRRLNNAKTSYQSWLGSPKSKKKCDWFSIDTKPPPRDVRTLNGQPFWTQDIDASKLGIKLNRHMVPPSDAEVLLDSKGDALIYRLWFDESQLIVVVNGSFLLNYSLVNHEHRKLAGKLITEIGSPEKRVMFLESGLTGPPISKREDTSSWADIWQFVVIVVHFAVVGILFCFSRFPILGLPRDLEPDRPADFGKHIDAMAELLEDTGDNAYASQRLAHYRQISDQTTATAQ